MNLPPPPRPFVRIEGERPVGATPADAGLVIPDERARAPSRPPLPGVAARDRDYAVLVVQSAAELDAHIASWDALAAAATEPNPFYESWMLLPALRAFGDACDFEFVLVFGYEEAAPAVNAELCGLFPLRRQRRISGVPARHRVGWRHDYCFSGVPLVRRGRERAVVEAFLDAMDTQRDGGGIVRFDQWPADGALHAALFDELDRRRAATYVRSRAARAFLRPSTDANAYLGDALTPKRRKEFGRLERRLAELGRVRYDALASDGDVDRWLADFIALEAKGWKGREGTAFQSRERDRIWLEEIARAAFAKGRLELLALRRDEIAIAFKLNLLAADGAFGFKIAFDEEWGRYSPGVLLEIENVRRIHAMGGRHWMDSCADPHHPMANRLWSGRRVYEDFFFALRGGLAAFIVSAMPLGRFALGAFRREKAPDDDGRST